MSREGKAAVKKAIQEWNSPTASTTPKQKTVGSKPSEQLHFLSLYEQLPLFEMEGAASNERSGLTRPQS